MMEGRFYLPVSASNYVSVSNVLYYTLLCNDHRGVSIMNPTIVNKIIIVGSMK